MSGKRSKTLVIHIISLSCIMLIYGFTVGPLTNIGGPLFNVRDWFNPPLNVAEFL